MKDKVETYKVRVERECVLGRSQLRTEIDEIRATDQHGPNFDKYHEYNANKL